MIGHAGAGALAEVQTDVEPCASWSPAKAAGRHREVPQLEHPFSPNEEASPVFRYGTAMRWPTLQGSDSS
jgi:hypothetical protein